MSEIAIQATAHWWTVGWVLSTLMLFVGFGIGVLYYKNVDETPPDVDESPEGVSVE